MKFSIACGAGKWLALGLLLLVCNVAHAQLELSVFSATGRGAATTFVTDYQAIGINPANLGVRKSFRDPKITFGLMEFNASFYSQALTRRELAQTIFRPQEINLSFAEKARAAQRFANSWNAINFDAMLVGFSFYVPKFGGVAFSLRDRVQMFARLNQRASEIMFLGHNAPYFTDLLLSNGRSIRNTPNLSDEVRDQVVAGFISGQDAQNYSRLLSGSRVSSSWYRELNFSYGTRLIDEYNFALHMGVGVKYMLGLAQIDLASTADQGVLVSNTVAMSPTFGLDFGTAAQVANPSFVGVERNASDIRRALLAKPVGRGMGFDFGLNMVIKRNFNLGISAVNFGNLVWNGNAYLLNDGQLREIQGAGINTYNILGASSESLQFAGDKSPLQWTGTRSITQQLPSVVRVGGSYEYFKTFHIGFDVVLPTNDVSGNLERPLYALGGDYQLNRWIRISTGVNFGGNQANKLNFPVGVTYTASRRFFEMGLATRDISTYLAGNSGAGSVLSFAAGFARFKY